MKNFKINQTIIRDGYEFRIIEINEFGWVARGKDGQGDVQIFKTAGYMTRQEREEQRLIDQEIIDGSHDWLV